MSVIDFIFGIIAITYLFVSFLLWIGAKYNLFQKNEKIEELSLELEVIRKKEECRKERQKKKGVEVQMSGKILKINNIDKSKYLVYKDEVDFIKKLRSLKLYCPRAYKDLIFKTNIQDLFSLDDGIYTKELFTDDLFKLVYGQIKLVYSVKNNQIIIENLTPQKFLIDGYFSLLKTYKGMPFKDKKDKFRIDYYLAVFRRKELEV